MWLGAAGQCSLKVSLWTANRMVTLLMEAMLSSGREYLREKMLLAPTKGSGARNGQVFFP